MEQNLGSPWVSLFVNMAHFIDFVRCQLQSSTIRNFFVPSFFRSFVPSTHEMPPWRFNTSIHPSIHPSIMSSACQPKYLVLILLVVQNTCLVLLMRYSRTRPGTMYLGSTAVCCDEAMKLVTCLSILGFTYYFQSGKGTSGSSDGDGGEEKSKNGMEETTTTDTTSNTREDFTDDIHHRQHPSNFPSYLREELQCDFRMAGLALLYTLQKNLLYLAISNLDAAVFQVTYQTKILTTALFSVILLKRHLSRRKVAALFLLTFGVALVQLDKVEENAGKSYQEQRRWVGVLAVLGACCTSGFGGVYFEWVLKKRTAQKQPSVWAKNVQLSTFALIIALVTAFLKDHKAILKDGFFQGYSPLVLMVITLEAGGGLVVAAVIKYADNILKSFATAVSIVTSTIVSMLVFGFLISKLFVCGSFLVFVAIGMYSKTDESNAGTSSGDGGDGKQTLCNQTSDIVRSMELGTKRSSGISFSNEDAPLEAEEGAFDSEEENVSLLRPAAAGRDIE
mmetsp:Transcript_24165/g.49521  ORF Transcript_24165/g.49521 Transcript_24165/m.49521 type:complete len:506 (+) Transcript_24165:357-1874(+)